MKKHSHISDKTFYRYLKNRDHLDFHLEVFKIFYKEADAAKHVQVSLQHLLYGAFCMRPPDKANLHYQTHQELVMLLELAHLLAEDREDLKYILHGELINERKPFGRDCNVEQGIQQNNNLSFHHEDESPRILFESFY